MIRNSNLKRLIAGYMLSGLRWAGRPWKKGHNVLLWLLYLIMLLLGTTLNTWPRILNLQRTLSGTQAIILYVEWSKNGVEDREKRDIMARFDCQYSLIMPPLLGTRHLGQSTSICGHNTRNTPILFPTQHNIKVIAAVWFFFTKTQEIQGWYSYSWNQMKPHHY